MALLWDVQLHGEDHASGNFSRTHVFENRIDVSQRTRCHLAVQLARGGQRQHLLQIFSRADCGRFDIYFAGGHHDGGEGNLICGQTDGKQSPCRTDAIKRRVVGSFRSRSNQRDVGAAEAAYFFYDVG